VVYGKHFLVWFGLMRFVCKLGGRRQANFHLNTDGPGVLPNLNRLAGTSRQSGPADETPEYFGRRVGGAPRVELRKQAVNRLVRMKALDAARRQGRAVVLIGGTGYSVSHPKHGDHCLTQRHGGATVYLHQVLEAELLGPAGTVFSIGTEFIDNRDAPDVPAGSGAERVKQDCELKALRRWLGPLRQRHPQLALCLGGDSRFACGGGLQLAKDHRGDSVYTFEPGRTPALWQDGRGLLARCPDQRVEAPPPRGARPVYRWVNGLPYTGSSGRPWTLNAIHCRATDQGGKEAGWAWVTGLGRNRRAVVAVATRGGRERWRAGVRRRGA
jgi:hypothetical protein